MAYTRIMPPAPRRTGSSIRAPNLRSESRSEAKVFLIVDSYDLYSADEALKRVGLNNSESEENETGEDMLCCNSLGMSSSQTPLTICTFG
jgi:hypothetical protein